MAESPDRPSGAPASVAFDGILDGRVAAEATLRQAAAALSNLGVGAFACEIDGGRFTLLPEGGRTAAPTFDETAQADFLAALTAVLEGAVPGTVESTLRCSMLYPAHVVETLFRTAGQRIEPMSRVRARTAADADAELADPAAQPPFGFRRREVMVLAPVLLLLGLLVAWQSGLVDRVLSARAETLAHDTGPFGAMVELRVQRSWGTYRVQIRRGPDYPADATALQRAQAAAESLAARAACDVVGGGGELWVQLRDAEGAVLAVARADLRPLLIGADGEVVRELPGRIRAASIVLSLTREQPKNR
jgi:hypothetical protein